MFSFDCYKNCMGTTLYQTRPGRPTTAPVVDRWHRSHQGQVSASYPDKMNTAASDLPASPSHRVRNWVHPDRRRGRGALSNVTGPISRVQCRRSNVMRYFETQAREVVDEGWDTLEKYHAFAPSLPGNADGNWNLLTPRTEHGLLKVILSVSTLDGKLARALEPRASQPAKRRGSLHASWDTRMAGAQRQMHF